jgi:hypothetical protein
MKWIVHIGLHKTATTSLQRAFAETPGILYVGKWPDGHYMDERSRRMVRTDVAGLAEHDPISPRLLAWKQDIQQAAADRQRSTIVISDELLCAGMLGRMATLQRYVGHDLLVVLVIRNQFDWIRSAYIQQLRRGITCSYQHFVAWHTIHFETGRFRQTRYAATCRFLAERGIAHVVMPFEHLTDPDSPHGNLAESLQIALPRLPHENRSPFDRSLIAWVDFNRKYAHKRFSFKEARFDGHYRHCIVPQLEELGLDITPFNDWYRHMGDVRRAFEATDLPPATEEDRAFMSLPPELEAHLRSRFAEQNKGLDQLLGIPDLDQRGYVLESR